ncbi:MAG: PSD1 and planctomycete cytochrome C domain-containing protein [Bryobacterales bacterium]|nr:PSD1 and planctomycete cytochrome C domain-containing protein [Bryobacterales bacterium]
MPLRPTIALAGLAGLALAQSPPSVDFLRDVQPVLTSRCLVCHSGDQPQAGLRLHTREEMLRGGVSGPAIVPGNGRASLLVQKISGQKGLRMPPTGPPLPEETIALIRAWIDQGARWDGKALPAERVAPLAPRKPEVPAGDAANPVDRFVGAYLARKRLPRPAPVSDALFARRIWYDIIGLPPSPEELAQFLADRRPDKRERWVDELLARRRAYAEHWITFWNDLLRNDEGVVYHGDRRSITNWLLAALERNLSYDQMVRTLLDPPEGSGAEGFLIGVTWRGVVSASQSPPMQAAQNAAQVFLGVNLKCAACHDSFVNRWKLRDTYGLAAMFTAEKLELVRCDMPTGEVAEPRFPFPELKVRFGESLASRRRAAAEWFTHPDNGRFARTIVNRYWKQLLGRGLVEPVDDMDAEPWDEDLLDWLAWDFAAHGYDLQHLIRRITTSQAYQMPAVREQAPPKTYVFRGPRLRRLTAEQFQDTISVVTGHWRVNNPRSEVFARYVREWRLKSDPLSRALGRPIRDQVYTERSTEATTLQALELTNGPLLAKRLRRGAQALLGALEPPPANRFDSKVVRKGSVEVDVDIAGARELYLVLEDVDTYDPERVVAGWVQPELIGPEGSEPLAAPNGVIRLGEQKLPALIARVPSTLHFKFPDKPFVRFRARVAIDDGSIRSDISPAVRFFVFTEKPDPEQLVKVSGEPPAGPPRNTWTSAELTERLYLHLLARTPTGGERALAVKMLGGPKPTATGVEDLLWALLMSPEFQFLH